VTHVRIRILHFALLATLAGLGLFGPATGIAREEDPRESSDSREVRETREARESREVRERELRDTERTRREAARETERERDDDRDDRDDGDVEDRSGSNSGSDGQSAARGSGRVEVERDTRGGDRQRGEVLLVGSQDNVQAVRNAGYTLLAERRLESLRRSMVRVRVRDGQSVEQLMESLRQLAPGARVAPNHIYNPSQLNSATVTRGNAATTPRARGAADIGIIDTGADAGNARLRPLLLAQRGFAPGGYQPRPHGTAVAQLAAGQGAKLAVADVFGVDARNHLVAPAELIAAAIDWMISQQIRVVNISIEGPYNAVLELVVEDAISRGVAIVAAAGNGGPSSAPAYPAAYAGVVAVTALDERGRIYRRAARGEHLQFAARGSYDVNQQLVETKVALSGTSFASPVVAAEIARRWHNLPGASRDDILAGMRADATDMGSPGHDAIYGWGRTATK
jgi:minor extracellular protease Epr